MSKNWIQISFVLISMSLLPLYAGAQSADDVLRYSLQYPSYDPISIVVPGVSQPTGLGGFQENPASMALFRESFMSLGLSNRYVSEQGRYLGNTTDFDDTQTSVGDLGFVYSVPTIRGSLVIGAGYSQTTDFNRALSVGGRNNESTLTDYYNITPDDSLFFAAFDVYAIDYAGPDSSYSNTASIFRIGFEEFPGINQDVELTERGAMGEYSIFAATEVQKGLMIGASIGLISGSYSYDRSFLETDRNNDYNFQFVDTDGDGTGDTDIDNILSEDVINADVTAFSARVGFVYQLTPSFNVGGSYQFKNKLSVDETYNTLITTTFDNGVEYFDQAPGRFSYNIVRPDRLNLGLTVKNLAGFSLSVAGEGVRYSEARIEFEDIQLRNDENAINQDVRSQLQDVINVRAGLEFEKFPLFTPRVGYGYYSSPRENFDAARQFFSGGFSTRLFDDLTLDLGAQYVTWEDRISLYSYDTGFSSGSERVREEVSRWSFMAGVKIRI